MRALTRPALPVLTAYLWVTMTSFGAVVLETVMVYPNVFADPPGSLELGMEFFALRGPSDVFPPLGLASWVLGAASLVLCRRVPTVRWWVLLSLIMFVAEGVVSMLYFWPRNEVLFVEGTAVHSAEHLRQVAAEFETWHARSRTVLNTVAAVAAFTALGRAYRLHVLATGSGARHGAAAARRGR
ncbi:DUF1772 domain-containing protein [Kocuria flava]|uniref:DUF1772 domain-containing protein n=1 Tax=Kocuria flava TaxID=446860 RepID=A0ABQ0X247_9MICC|nr:DUF1772 domain-containing protein [Kocuria flava]GEO91415.1 hypothetical protein KFL01_07210 [Kocuria flava]